MCAMTPRHLISGLAALSLVLTPLAAAAETAPARKAAPAVKQQPKAAPAPRATGGEYNPLIGHWELEGALGLAVPFESGVNTGFKLAGSGFYGLQTLSPGVLLQVGGTVGWTYNGYGGGLDGSVNTVDLLPTARIRMAVNPKLFVYGDGGLGIGIVHAKATFPGFGSTSTTDASLLIKLGGGVGFDLKPNLTLGVEPALNFYVKSGSITQFTLMAGLLYRI